MIAGGAAALALLSTLAGGLAASVPSAGALGPLARMLDGFAPWFVAIGLILAILTAILGAWRSGLVLALAAAGAGAMLVTTYLDVTRPVDAARDPELRVLFFNAFARNSENGARIVDAAMATGADILVFAEAEAVMDHRDALSDAYGFVTPCMGETCELLIATNLPVLRSWQLRLNTAWAERYAVLEVEVPGHGPMFLAAAHLTKPWMSGIAEPELAQLRAQLDWLDGPSVVVGDFNMPPWSGPMAAVLDDSGFRAARMGPGTWPSGAPAPLRLPIDHVLVTEDVAVTTLTPFGDGLGSNHLGVLAGISLR
jgi:endonuclease/exonuclease/phosphatase (EEP) superfamily protein YafD